MGSRHTTQAETGTHAFEIVGYTLKKGIGVGKFIRSGTFTVGGYDWSIRFYSDGFNEATKEHVSVYLELMSKNANVRASYGLSLVNKTTRLPESLVNQTTARLFNSSNLFSSNTLVARSKLELKSAGYIVDNCLTIECSVTVIKASQVSQTTGDLQIEVPPSDLSEHFGKLLLEEEGADVTFCVEGETFPAHKIVLATRYPVFKAELYGQMKETRALRVTVADMQPGVFKALLHFVYTDSLPDWEDLDDGDYTEIAKHLLVAADRYAMDRLKLTCANILVKYLDAETGEMEAVVATHGYANLKRTCPSILVDVLEKTSRYRKT